MSAANGWCCGFGDRPPHYVDDLIDTNAPVPLCRLCWSRWNRTDREVPTHTRANAKERASTKASAKAERELKSESERETSSEEHERESDAHDPTEVRP